MAKGAMIIIRSKKMSFSGSISASAMPFEGNEVHNIADDGMGYAMSAANSDQMRSLFR
jgi:hypothetical protein